MLKEAEEKKQNGERKDLGEKKNPKEGLQGERLTSVR